MKFSKSIVLMVLFLIMFTALIVITSIKMSKQFNQNLLIESNQFSLSIVEVDAKIHTSSCIPNKPNRTKVTEDIEDKIECDDSVTNKEQVSNSNYIYLSDSEVRELATLVYLEAGGESFECQKAVASVVINRMTTGQCSLKDVIYAKNQFSPAGHISSSEPSESTIDAVQFVIEHGPTIPEYVTFFRAKYYHSWSGQVPYMSIDNTYFSYDEGLKHQIENS